MNDAPPASHPSAGQQTNIPEFAGPSLDSLKTLVASEFHVQDAFLDPNGLPTIVVSAEPPKRKFEKLLDQLAEQGLVAALRSAPSLLIIKVFQKPKLRPSRRKVNLAMFLATVFTVSVAGYFLWTYSLGDPVLSSQFDNILAPGASPLVEAAAFTIGLLAIIGLHEFGHKATANIHKMDSTLPYFIPGPPPIGTFGALISLRSPPRNRDHLFDLGLSGPVVGFIVTIVVTALSIAWGVSLSQPRLDEINALIANCGAACTAMPWPNTPLILTLVCQASSNCISPNFSPNQQLSSAAQIGALLTFLNIVPAWQLDGGHISRAVYGPAGHRVSSYIGLGLLLLAGYWPFAFLIFIMMGISGRGLAGVEPLDDVSPLSNSRRVAYLVGIA
ncbi:site-2 protease family protein, partial [Candidatus Bathyarchaeota archaeon]|nr:site-2 protease family protein [Candidatus Bathyarchaeota archaeon]